MRHTTTSTQASTPGPAQSSAWTPAALRRAMGAGDPAALADAWQVGRYLWPALRALGYDGGYLGRRGANSDALAGRPPHLRTLGTPPGYLSFVAMLPPAPGHDRIRLHRQGADLPRLPEHRGQLDVVLQDVPFKQSPATAQQAQALAEYGTKALTEGVVLSARGGISVSLVHTQVLDSPDPTGRKRLARQADLVGALRLPPRPGPDGAGVPFDVVLLRRRSSGARGTGHPFTDICAVPLGDQLVTVNEYFTTHPDHVLSRVLPGPGGSALLVPEADRARLGRRIQEAFTRIGGTATQRRLTAPGFLSPPTPDLPSTQDARRPADARPHDDVHL
ncbi:hypothetical protein ACIG47_19405 [Promicromonospora sp. NPDC052451]|uniref:hypothetical protein n=1 Tax=Promicromonospora sp. NPDC052451 TaxID=3364407 RepID=UPI0037C965AD